MLYVSIIVEMLRLRPARTVMCAIGAQVALWTFIPGWFYAGPPGNLPFVLAVGHQFQIGSAFGPPLAFWLAELVFDLAGHHLIAVYALSQACVAATYWAVFRLGREIVGAQHAALAVLAMVGISSFTVASPDFGPAILAMPLWAFALTHYWLTLQTRRQDYGIALAVELALLLATTDAALLLIGVLLAFSWFDERARALVFTRAWWPVFTRAWWPAGIAVAVMLAPHIYFLVKAADGFLPALARLRAPEAVLGNFATWVRLIALIVAAQAGLIVLAGIAVPLPWTKPSRAPVIVRAPLEPFGRKFIYLVATAPALLAAALGAVLGAAIPVGGTAPLIVLSGLALVIAAGDAIVLVHQRLLVLAWFGLLLGPPVLTLIAMLGLPLVGTDLAVNQPAPEIGRFFAESFERRTGKPLAIVAGDPRTAALIGLGAPSRPSLFLQDTPARSPWVSMEDVKTKGAIVVWPTGNTAGTPPPGLAAIFPDLVPEVPKTFARTVEGRLPLLRYGWAVIRPQAAPEPPPAAVAPKAPPETPTPK
jgi:hypothetical protein